MFTFRLSLTIWDCTTCGWWIIQLYKYFFIWSLIFELILRFFNAYGVVPDLFYLRFDSAAPTRRVAVLFFTSYMLVKRHSEFVSLGFLTGVDVMVHMGLLLVHNYVVETIESSIISLNCCWLSHLPACLYNFFMFWIHLC